MIFAISGSQGTGKSSLINHIRLSASNQYSPFYESICLDSESRVLWKQFQEIFKIKDWKEATAEQQKIYQFALNTRRTAQVAKYAKYFNHNVFLDRSTLDSAAYVQKNIEDGIFDEHLGKFLLSESRAALDLIDLTFLLVPEFDLEDDGFRNYDKTEQLRLSEIMKSTLIKWDLPYQILTGSVQQRCDTIESVIRTSCYFNADHQMITKLT